MKSIYVIVLLGMIILSIFIEVSIGQFLFESIQLSDSMRSNISIWTDYLPVTAYLFLIAALIFRSEFKQHYRKLSFTWLFYTICGATTLILKPLIGRQRPIQETADLNLDNLNFHFFQSYDYYFASMPSGHTAVSIGLALALSRMYPAVSGLIWLIAIMITTSRLFMSVHWLSDIIVSVLIVFLLDRFIYQRLKSKLSVDGTN